MNERYERVRTQLAQRATMQEDSRSISERLRIASSEKAQLMAQIRKLDSEIETLGERLRQLHQDSGETDRRILELYTVLRYNTPAEGPETETMEQLRAAAMEIEQGHRASSAYQPGGGAGVPLDAATVSDVVSKLGTRP